jgi:hypothetical protein
MFWPCLAVEFNSNTFEKHTPEQIDSDSLRKAVYTRVFSGFKCFRLQSFSFFPRIQGFRIRPTTEMIFHRIRRCMCKRMYESDAKMFRFCDESGIFRSSVNGVLDLDRYRLWSLYLVGHTSKPGPDTDSDSKKIRTREKSGLVFKKTRTWLLKTRTRNRQNRIQNKESVYENAKIFWKGLIISKMMNDDLLVYLYLDIF